MDVDATGTAHILLSTMTALKYIVQREAGGWDVETIDDAALGLSSIFGISLALDNLARPHISYVHNERSRKALTYAFKP